MTDRNGLLRLAALVGTSSALYAVALGTVATLQSQADAAIAAGQEPAVRAVDDMVARNDALEAELRRNADRYASLVDAYDRVTADLFAIDDSVRVLSDAVTEVNGGAATLPEGVSLPRLPRPATISVTRTTIHATTGASGD